MPHITDESGALALTLELEEHVTRRVARCRVDLDEIVKPVSPTAHQVGFAVLENRHDAFPECAQFGRSFLRIGIDLRKIVHIRLGKDVPRIGKCRHPFPIFLLGIPADMIVMQMGAHHEVDVLGPRSRGGKPLEVGQIEHVPEGTPGLGFVVAAARVDQDLLAADLQQPAVNRQLDQSCIGFIMVRRQPGLVLGHMRVVEFRKNFARRIGRKVCFLDARDDGIAYGEHQHPRNLFFWQKLISGRLKGLW
jgi:hypothetical protein